MPRKRVNKSVERRSEDDDEDFFFDDTQSNSGKSSHEPQHRNAANARERARMRVLSKAFCRLKTTLPWVPADTKLSKLDTLRLAASYIAHLRALLHEPRSAKTSPPHPLTLAWPFAFQHGGSLSCSVSQRWNASQCNDSNVQNLRENESSQLHCNNYEYENDYDDHCYEEMISNNINGEAQYCHNGYKNDYHNSRNTSVHSIINECNRS